MNWFKDIDELVSKYILFIRFISIDNVDIVKLYVFIRSCGLVSGELPLYL